MGGGLAGGQAEELVAAVDIDGDGKISMAELSLVMVRMLHAHVVRFEMPFFSFIRAPLTELSLVTVKTDAHASIPQRGRDGERVGRGRRVR